MTNLVKRDVDSVRRQVEAWLKTREGGCSLVADGKSYPDYEFIFRSYHALKPFYVGLGSELGVIEVMTDVRFSEEERVALRKEFPTPKEYTRFLRGLYRSLIEPGCSFVPRLKENFEIEGYQVIGTLYPFESGGLNRRDFETIVQSVISATLRGVYYFQDVVDIEPTKPPTDERRRPEFWDPMVS
jgi:hypothetical protein